MRRRFDRILQTFFKLVNDEADPDGIVSTLPVFDEKPLPGSSLGKPTPKNLESSRTTQRSIDGMTMANAHGQLHTAEKTRKPPIPNSWENAGPLFPRQLLA